MILLRRGQDAAQAETWIRLENGALLHQSKNPRYAAGRQTVCEPGEATLALPHHAVDSSHMRQSGKWNRGMHWQSSGMVI